jgi:hypothetical protein
MRGCVQKICLEMVALRQRDWDDRQYMALASRSHACHKSSQDDAGKQPAGSIPAMSHLMNQA